MSKFQLEDLEDEKSQLETNRICLEDEVHLLKKRLEVLDGVASQVRTKYSSFTLF